MDIVKLVKKAAPWLVPAGLVLVIFGIICFASAANGRGLLQDAYYMMDLDHEYGRFSPGMARRLFAGIGILDETVTGFQRFSMGAGWPFFLLGIAAMGTGIFVMFRTGMVTLYGLKEVCKLILERLPEMKDRAASAVSSLKSRGKCAACGARLPAGAAFCQHCGVKVEKASGGEECLRCGHMNESGARYCKGCGRPMGRG